MKQSLGGDTHKRFRQAQGKVDVNGPGTRKMSLNAETNAELCKQVG